MEDMNGSAFRTSRTERDRRRSAGPVLTLVRGGAADAPAPSSAAHRAHPAFEGFTPDGVPGPAPRHAVHASGPESSTGRRPSRGSASPDDDGPARSGPGPHVPQAELVRLLADHLARVDAHRAVDGPAAVAHPHR
jgi:hypothetical protein